MGALLAARGLRTRVMLRPRPCPRNIQAAVFDTESRHVPSHVAEERVRDVARLLPPGMQPDRVFKKIDSTMRGNVRAEIGAIAGALGNVPVLWTPAYPSLGRVVCGGILSVRGRPVAETEFGRDPLSPVADSRVPGAADACTDDDLRRIATSGGALLAGSGGLGRFWADGVPGGSFAPVIRRAGKPLVICGSAHPVSRGQLARAQQLGIPVCFAPEHPQADPEAVEQRLTRESQALIRRMQPDLLILFGGETAWRVLRSVRVSVLHPLCEVRPGIAVSAAKLGGREIMVVTKAGGFGEPADMDRILEELTC